MERRTYIVIEGAPGSLLDPPTDPPVVWYDEAAGEQDERCWCHRHAGVTNRYFREGWALMSAGGVVAPND